MKNKPNILFIMADDHAAKAISSYGGGINNTPNIDRIANEGVRFDHCYVTNSICTPSRAAILTGTYNHVNCVKTLDTHMDNELPNVAKHLKTGGYETAIVGSGIWVKANRTNQKDLIFGQFYRVRENILIHSWSRWAKKKKNSAMLQTLLLPNA